MGPGGLRKASRTHVQRWRQRSLTPVKLRYRLIKNWPLRAGGLMVARSAARLPLCQSVEQHEPVEQHEQDVDRVRLHNAVSSFHGLARRFG